MWKFIAALLLAFNVVRMGLILLSAYLALHVADKERAGVAVMIRVHPQQNCTKLELSVEQTPSVRLNGTVNCTTKLDFNGDSDFSLPKITWQKSPGLSDSLFLTVSILEITWMLIITFFIMGPLTRKILFRTWMSSMSWYRITWKRVLFVVVAIVYSQLYLEYRKKRYEYTFHNPKYEDSTVRKVMLWMTVVEYFTLGLAEISAKLFTLERIKNSLLKFKKKIGNMWGTMDEQEELSNRSEVSLFTVVVVLQTVIVLIRGKYGNFFLYLCLSFFLNEGEKFNELLQDDDKEKNEVQNV